MAVGEIHIGKDILYPRILVDKSLLVTSLMNRGRNLYLKCKTGVAFASGCNFHLFFLLQHDGMLWMDLHKKAPTTVNKCEIILTSFFYSLQTEQIQIVTPGEGNNIVHQCFLVVGTTLVIVESIFRKNIEGKLFKVCEAHRHCGSHDLSCIIAQSVSPIWLVNTRVTIVDKAAIYEVAFWLIIQLLLELMQDHWALP